MQTFKGSTRVRFIIDTHQSFSNKPNHSQCQQHSAGIEQYNYVQYKPLCWTAQVKIFLIKSSFEEINIPRKIIYTCILLGVWLVHKKLEYQLFPLPIRLASFSESLFNQVQLNSITLLMKEGWGRDHFKQRKAKFHLITLQILDPYKQQQDCLFMLVWWEQQQQQYSYVYHKIEYAIRIIEHPHK